MGFWHAYMGLYGGGEAVVGVLADTSRRLRVPYLASDTRRAGGTVVDERRPQRPTDGVDLGP